MTDTLSGAIAVAENWVREFESQSLTEKRSMYQFGAQNKQNNTENDAAATKFKNSGAVAASDLANPRITNNGER